MKWIASVGLLAMIIPSFVSAAFSDVSADMPAAKAIEALSARGIVKGYPDGTFRPKRTVNRAEAVHMLVHALFEPAYIGAIARSVPMSFNDVPRLSWFETSVEIARQNGAIDGPDVRSRFNAENIVTEASFLKMLFILDRQDVRRFASEGKPLANDVRDSMQWFYPYCSLAVATTTLIPNDEGNLLPQRQLTRADVASMLDNYMRFKEGGRESFARDQFRKALDAFAENQEDPILAAQMSYRAILLSAGMLQRKPSDPSLQALQNIAWAFGKVLKGDVVQAKSYLLEAKKLSGAVYEEYAPLAAAVCEGC